MSDRLSRARRVLAIQSQFERLARWQFADLESQQLALEARERSLLCLLQQESNFTPIFSSAIMRRLHILAEQVIEVNAGKERQRIRQLEERRRLRAAERLVSALEDNFQRAEALRELNEAIGNDMRRGLTNK